jgi:hypothetical protein
MALTLDRMRHLLRKGLGGLDATDLPDDEADELLNMSLWELEDRFDFKEKECLISGPLTEGVREFGLPSSIDAIITVNILRTDEPHTRRKLIRLSFDDLSETPEGTTDEEFRGEPLYYTRRNRTLILTPTPDDGGWTLEVLMWRAVQSIVDDPGMTVGLPRNWHELVIEGAVVRGHFYNEDYTLAQQASNFQVTKVRSAVSTNTKEERDNRFARLRVLREDPEDRLPRR